MSWWQFSLQCPASKLEQIEEILLSLQAQSISISDAGDEPIYEPLPGTTPLWSRSIVTATFDQGIDPDSLQQKILTALPTELGSGLRRKLLQEQDWEQAYRNHFQPLECAPGLWIVPSWCQPPEPEATIITLDPGLAFGTGGHPTTALCLAWLGTQDIAGKTVIDYGCGSGILAIAASKLGATRVLAVDIDPQALQACETNLASNGIDPARIELHTPESIPASTSTDLLLANILAGPLKSLERRFAQMVVADGEILLSGILKTQLPEIQSAYGTDFDLDPPRSREQWASISGRRVRATNG